MKTALLALAGAAAVALLGPHAASASQRRVDSAFASAAIGARLHFEVYLPQGYDAGSQRYPVLYVLHGLPSTASAYTSLGFVERALDSVGRPAIVVDPAGGARRRERSGIRRPRPRRPVGDGDRDRAAARRRRTLPDDPFTRRPRADRHLRRRLRSDAARAQPPGRVLRRRIVERLLPPHRPDRHEAARSRLGRPQREGRRPPRAADRPSTNSARLGRSSLSTWGAATGASMPRTRR